MHRQLGVGGFLQQGSIIRAERKHGPAVWQFRWSETGPQGQRVYRKRVVGTIEDYADSEAVRVAFRSLIAKSTSRVLQARPATMTVGELPRVAQLAQKVVNRHGSTKPELLVIANTLMKLDEELTQHLAKEEAVLFPYIAGLERSITIGTPRPRSCFGTVANPIAMTTQEHDAAGALIAEIRRLSGSFTTPVDACPTFHALYDGLREFEQDLHQHIHLENNIHFPRDIELENSTS